MLKLLFKKLNWKELAGVLAMEIVFFYTMTQMDYGLNLENYETVYVIVFKLLTAAVSLFFAAASFAILFYLPRYLVLNRYLQAFLYLCLPLFLFSNVIYYRYFEMPLNLGALYSIGNLPLVVGYAYSLAEPADLLYLLCACVLVYVGIGHQPERRKGRLKTAVILTLVFLLSAMARTGVYVVSLSVKHGDIERAVEDTILNKTDFSVVCTRYGFLTLFANNLLSIKGHRGPGSAIDARAQYINTSPIRTGDQLGPNVVMVQVESLDYEVLREKAGDKEITPFLNSMIDRSLFFTSFYAQHTGAGGTSDADFSSLTSLYPLAYKPSFYAKGLEKLPALPFVMHLNGYSTAAFHANKAGFWGRSTALKDLGFGRFYSLKDYAGLPGKGVYVADGPFLERTLEFIDEMDEPYYAYIITISSHGDYSRLKYVSEEIMDNEIKVPDDKQTENYFRVINYVDSALKNFHEGLVARDRPFILFIYGDHTSGISSDEYVSRADHAERIPLFIIASEGVDPNRIDTPASQIDLPPSVLSFTDIPSPSDWQGIDLLSQDRQRLFLKNRRISVEAGGSVRLLGDGDTQWDNIVFKVEDYIQ